MNKIVFGIIVLVVGFGLLISACGQKGPLVLPKENTKQERKHGSF